MKHHLASLLGVLGLWLCVVGASRGQATNPPTAQDEAPQKGVEVLTQGPIHEAFAEPVTVNPQPNPIIHKKPPAPIEEIPPDEKPEGDHIQWIPGYFAWDEVSTDFIWISGFWRATPPGQHWVPGRWIEAEDGWQWVSGYWTADTETEVEYLPPPPQSIDTGPTVAAPDADSLYAPGIWVYQDNRYLWRPGYWYRGNPNWCFYPAHYTWTPAGCIFSEGYWDYPLDLRGLLFSPVRFTPGIWNTAGWYYQPRYALAAPALLGSLFARPGYGRYYFGDYYAPELARQGFVPWFDHHPGRNIPDPLFNYTRWRHARANPQWEQDLRTLHRDRLAGTAPRPAATLAQQARMLRDITVNKQFQIGNKTMHVTNPEQAIQHARAVAPLTQLKHDQFKLQPFNKERQVEQRKIIQQLHTSAQERHQREQKIISQTTHATRPMPLPARVKVAPHHIATPPHPAHVQTPPRPAVPMHVQRPIPKHEPARPIHVHPPPHKK